MEVKTVRTEIPTLMYDSIRATIEAGKYCTLSDFVRTAVREQLRREGSA